MEEFRAYLKREYLQRTARNPGYSLRAFSKHLGISHATLSTLLSGKRKFTKAAALNIAKHLGINPEQFETHYCSNANQSEPYYRLQEDAFTLMSEWYFDAILELFAVYRTPIDSKIIANALGISELTARMALDILIRLELLTNDSEGHLQITNQNTTNIVDSHLSTAAMRKLQASLLEKSAEALQVVPRALRDHSSVTVAIDVNDLSEVKNLIKKFRRELSTFVQREDAEASSVYQLQIGFFPLTHEPKIESNKE
jgi:uncharacterized protein (TIGR02147 family)